MKLHLHTDHQVNLISHYDPGQVTINQRKYSNNLIVTATVIVTEWSAVGYADLKSEDFEAILKLNPEVVLIGTGARQRFPPSALLRPLIDTNIGFEFMDIPAACRTYNLLVSEKRAVAAALLFDPAS